MPFGIPKGRRMKTGFIYHLGVSTGYITLTLFIASCARLILKRISPEPTPARKFLLEAVAAWELCAACFELIIIADNYGVLTYALYLFLLTIWWAFVWEESSACSYTYLEEIIEGTSDLITAVAATCAQLGGTCLVFGYIQFLWSLEWTRNHRGRAFEQCTTDLQVSAVFAFLIELFATLLCRLASRIIATKKPNYATAIDSFIGTSLVVLAFNYSGGYFNPILATSLKYGCKGHTNAQHIFVYWIGSTIGAILSVWTFRFEFIQKIAKRKSE